MDRIAVASSTIAAIGFDEASQTLEVEFNEGSIYQYYNVPSVVYDQLMAAPSKGQFLHYQVKGQFPFDRVG